MPCFCRLKGVRALYNARRLFVMMVLSLSLIGLIASCGAPSTAPVQISFACFDSERPFYSDSIEAFEQANPEIRIRLVSLDQVFGAQTAEGELPEYVARRLVAAADTLSISPDLTMTRQGLVRDLTPFIQADRVFDAEDFYPSTLQGLQWDGGTWGLPTSVKAFHAVFYDKDAFDTSGVPYPKPGWTWDDFLNKAIALTQRQNDQVVRWGFVEQQWDPSPFVQGRVGLLVDSSGEPPVPVLERSTVAEAVRWYVELALVHKVMPIPKLEDAALEKSEANGLVQEGRAAMWSATTASWDQWSAGRALGIVPFPVDSTASTTTPMETSAAVMSAGTSHPEESWLWLEFLSRQVASSGRLPVRRSVAEGSGYWQKLGKDEAATYEYALEHGLPQIKSWMWLGYALYDALESVFGGETDVAEALADAQRQVQASVAAESGGETAKPPVVPTPRSLLPTDSSEHQIVFVSARSELRQVYDALAAEFRRIHPGIVVEVHDLSEFVGREGTGSGQETVPILAERTDCFAYPWQTWSTDDRRRFLSLDPLLEADLTFAVGDFYPPAMNVLRVDGRLLGLPLAVHPRMIFYHKALFDAAGLAYPSPGWALDDFLALAVALTKNEGDGKQYAYLSDPQNADAAFFIEQQGAYLLDVSDSLVTYRFDAPVTVRAVQWYASLSSEYGVMPKPWFGQPDYETALAQWRSWETAVEDRRVAMWSGYPNYTPVLTSGEQASEVGMSPMPWGAGRVTDFQMDALYISAQTEQPQACWEWLKFLTSQTGLFSGRQDGLPGRLSVAGSAAYHERVGEEVAAVYEEVLKESERPGLSLYSMNQPDVGYPLRWFFGAVQSVLDGQEAEWVLGEAQRKAGAYVNCLQTKRGLEGDELTKACVREVDPDFTFYVP